MTNLGKCLLFYLKYPAEMKRLLAKEPKVEGLPNPDEVLKKIKLVGDAANREAAEFLESCAQGINEHFTTISTVQRMRNNLETTWYLGFKVAPKEAPDRRFEIGVTIAGGAKVILLDEPTAGMDNAETARAVELIRRISEGRTLLIVEHDMGVVFGLANRISVLVYGEIIATGTPAAIRADARVREAYLGEAVA